MRFPTASWSQTRTVVGQQLSHIPRARSQAFVALALLTAGACANVAIPILLGKVIDTVIVGGAITPVAISLVLMAAVSALLSASGFYVVSRLTERVIANLREDMVATALRLPTHRVEEAGTGDLVSRSTDDVAELSAAVTDSVPVLAKSLFAVAATGLALVSLNWQYVMVVAAVTPLYFLPPAATYIVHHSAIQMNVHPWQSVRVGFSSPYVGEKQCGLSAWKSTCVVGSSAPPRGSRQWIRSAKNNDGLAAVDDRHRASNAHHWACGQLLGRKIASA